MNCTYNYGLFVCPILGAKRLNLNIYDNWTSVVMLIGKWQL